MLYVLAALAFLVAAVLPATARTTYEDGSGRGLAMRLNFVAAGLFFWVLVPLCNLIDDIAND